MPYYSQDMIGGAMNASHIYYNINISNDYSGYDISSNGQVMQVNTNTKELQLVFNQSRAQPYLINPSKYFLSVQRFTIESPNLPVFICQPIVGQADVDKSIYSITLQRQSDGATQTRNISWQPDDKTVPVPSGVVTTSWQTNKYYYCYSYQHFIDLINNAFESFSAFLGVTSPYIYMDYNTHLAGVGGDATLYRTDLQGNYLSNGTGYKIYFNIALYNLFSSLKAIYKGTAGPAIGADYQLVMDTGTNNNAYIKTANTTISATATTNIYTLATGAWITLPVAGQSISVSGFTGGFTANNGVKTVVSATSNTITVSNTLVTAAAGPSVTITYIQPYITNIYENLRTNSASTSDTNDVINVQEYSTLPLWTPIKNIVFRTSLLNVAPDIVGTPVVFEQGDLNINNGKSNTDILNIMIDHTVPLTIGTEYRPFIYFEPIGEFRLVELYGNQPINSMDIAVFWKDSFGNLIPFVLDIGASATMKLLFRKKTFNSDKI